MPDGESAPAPISLALDLSALPPSQRVEAWKASFSPAYELLDASPDMEARGRMLRFGDAALFDTFQPRSFARDAAAARRDGLDTILIATEAQGGSALETAAGEQRVDAGRITLIDVARPVVKQGAPGRTLSIAAPRDLVTAALPSRDLHGLTLPDAGLLVEHMHLLARRLLTLAPSAAPHLARATVDLLAACLEPTGERLERAAPVLSHALRERALRHMRAHAHDPRLTPERLAAAMGVSRASLYRAFEADEGVAAMLRQTRLDAAAAALRDPADARRIGEIGFAYGFGSEAHFSRAVRRAFGLSPRDMRHGARAHHLRPISAAPARG